MMLDRWELLANVGSNNFIQANVGSNNFIQVIHSSTQTLCNSIELDYFDVVLR
jgi:hypothetical protein